MAKTDSLIYYYAFDNDIVPLTTKDSIIQKKIEVSPSLFGSKTDGRPYKNPKELLPQAEFQPYWILLFSMLLLAFIANLMYREFNNFLLGFFSNRTKSVNAYKEEKLGFFSRIVSLFFILNLSVFLYRFIEIGHLTWTFQQGTNKFYLIVLILLGLWIAKTIFTLLIHSIFTSFKKGLELLKISQQVELIMTIILIPINLLYFYTFQSIEFGYVGLGLLLILLLAGLVKLFISLKQISTLHNYQIIIYLCTLEILPLMVIFKNFL